MTAQRARRSTSRLVGVVLLALLLAPWSAFRHAVAHAPALSAGPVHHAAATLVGAAAAADDGTGHPALAGMGGLTDHEAGSAVCHWFDHLLWGQAPGSEGPPAVAARRCQEVPPAQPASALASTAPAAYQARGPPRA